MEYTQDIYIEPDYNAGLDENANTEIYMIEMREQAQELIKKLRQKEAEMKQQQKSHDPKVRSHTTVYYNDKPTKYGI